MSSHLNDTTSNISKISKSPISNITKHDQLKESEKFNTLAKCFLGCYVTKMGLQRAIFIQTTCCLITYTNQIIIINNIRSLADPYTAHQYVIIYS